MIDEFAVEPLVVDKIPQQTKVVVAMSGGVDSSTVAALLHNLGYQVTGITLELYSSSSTKKGACCAGQDIYDAKRVAEIIGFPHYVLNYKEVFQKEVIEDFTNSYARGETPIPCIKCNQTVKFRDLLAVTQNLGADVLVTGHYIRRIEKDGEVQLHSGKDKSKDQSYFLFATTSKQLKFLRFPLGGFCKSSVRELARYFNLKIAEKPDSQDICFVADKYSNTIAQLKPESITQGKIIHINGKVLGEHNGIVNFTVGQRRGLGVSYHEPLYVVKIDAKNQEVIVGPVDALMQNKLFIKELNWLAKDQIPSEGLDVTVKLRSSHSGSAAKIYPTDESSEAAVILKNDYFGISPGQACVAYLGERVLGGGYILPF